MSDCEQFELDMVAAAFGTCKCGAHKSVHSAGAIRDQAVEKIFARIVLSPRQTRTTGESASQAQVIPSADKDNGRVGLSGPGDPWELVKDLLGL